jgi:hypothetical protein
VLPSSIVGKISINILTTIGYCRIWCHQFRLARTRKQVLSSQRIEDKSPTTDCGSTDSVTDEQVVLSLWEVMERKILIADKQNGRPLQASDDPYRLIAPGDSSARCWLKQVLAVYGIPASTHLQSRVLYFLKPSDIGEIRMNGRREKKDRGTISSTRMGRSVQ